MITFRQKEFVAFLAPLLSKVGIGGALAAADIGVGLKGASDQKRISEEQAEQQEKLARQQRKSDARIAEALNNIASKNPAAAPQAAQLAMQQRSYTFTRNLVGLGKDLGTLVRRNKVGFVGTTLTGVAMGTAGYLTDKGIQKDMKKSGIPLPPKEEKREKKYSVMSSVAKSSGKFLKESGKIMGQAVKSHKTGIMMMTGLTTIPTVLGYSADKKAYKDQLAQTKKAEKQYSKLGKTLGKTIKSTIGKAKGSLQDWHKDAKQGWKTFKSHPGQSTLGSVSNLMQGGGRKGVEKFGKDLEQLGRKNNSSWSTKLGQLTQKYPKTAIAASIPVGAATMAVTWDAGQKIAEGTARKLDKNAFRYQDSQNQQIQ